MIVYKRNTRTVKIGCSLITGCSVEISRGAYCCILLLITVLWLFVTPALAAAPVKSKSTSQTKKYMAQEHIDTSIQRAFYILNEAASMAGVGFKQKQAIDQAKKIAYSLRERAKGDPNERYILWKVSELDAQIYLEEKDIVLMQMQQGQISVNELVARYNQEVGKPRPDFAAMRRLHVQMGRLDIAKANQMADSYNNRYRSISNEIMNSLESALDNGDLEKAREGLGYCLRNASYLSISASTYNNFERRVEKLTAARCEKPLIEQETSAAIAALAQNNLSVARDNLSRAEQKLAVIKKYLPGSEIAPLSVQISNGNFKLLCKEDSLVKLNMSILSKDGVSAADEFLRTVVRPSGVSVEKAALIDKAILSVNAPEDLEIHDEIGTLSSDKNDEQQTSMLDEIMAKAKIKAQKKADSLRLIEEEALRISLAQQRYQDSIAETLRAAELIELQKKRQNTETASLDIYTSLEKNDLASAQKQFNRDRPFLLQYLEKNDFYILESTLQRFSIASAKSGGTIGTVSKSEPGRSTTAPTAPPVRVATNISYTTSSVPAVNGYTAPLPKTIEEKLEQNLARAQREIAQIYNMLENERISEAYNRFQQIRKPLQMFLHAEVFSMLESTVFQAWEFYQSSSASR